MADHLRRWNHHAVHVVQRMQTDARQPVVQPERVGTGSGKGLRQGQACTILAPMPEQCLRTGHASLLQRFGKIDRLAVLAQSHEHRHLACRAAAEAGAGRRRPARTGTARHPALPLSSLSRKVAQDGWRLRIEREAGRAGRKPWVAATISEAESVSAMKPMSRALFSGASEPPAQAWLRIALSVITTSSAGERRGPSRFPVRRRRRRRAFP